jgi:hypothetical protein
LYGSLRVNPQKVLAVNARMMVGLGPARVRLRQIDNGHTSCFSTRSEEPGIPSRHPPKPPPGPDDWRQETQQRSRRACRASDATGRKAAPRPSIFTGSLLKAFPSLRVKHRIFDDERLRRTGDEYLSGIAVLFPVANISSDSRTIFRLKGESSRLRLVLVRRASSPALE